MGSRYALQFWVTVIVSVAIIPQAWFVLPVALVVTGLVVWRRRRRDLR